MKEITAYRWAQRIPITPNTVSYTHLDVYKRQGGARGGASVLEIAEKRFPFDGAEILQTFSLPKFHENFEVEKGILDDEKLKEMEGKIEKVKSEI